MIESSGGGRLTVMGRDMAENERIELRGSKAWRAFQVSIRSLYWIQEYIGSQWRDMKKMARERDDLGSKSLNSS